nr:hypothetical protein [Tanacetum cinerariifolium]
IMGKPLSPDRVFDFLMDEPEPHLAYDRTATRADEPMVGLVVDEIAELIVEMREQMVAPVIDVEEDIALLFDDDDFSDDEFEGFKDDEDVWEVNEERLMALFTPLLMPVIPPPSTYEVGGPSTAAEGQSFTLLALGFLVPLSVIKDLSTRMDNLEYRHGQLVKRVIQVSDARVADDITIREIGPRVSAVEGHVQVMMSQVVQAVDRLEQVGAQVDQGQETAT